MEITFILLACVLFYSTARKNDYIYYGELSN